ncbi:effector-associated domain EAD1-containing protein [Chondromyces apiculatus]|uniref:NACHT domain-containing protein n=1 Tax=Chondromyces apiculatus DSM 436 TaxID=1192034 RepID=A0A017SU53_9BACT|nr:effector-associated domain EAD1-containing protein [Chondromyces apiculatus]EYF00115.1 Hypothetical protein CAP_1354 [Chondromyces apiculatus DSM 436]
MHEGAGSAVASPVDVRGETVGGEIIDFEVERERHGKLFAREDVLRRLREWLVGERALSRGWILLLGGPGAGKSAILMQMLKVLPDDTPCHLIRRGNEGWDRPEVVVQNLCAQIERQFHEQVDLQQPVDARLGDLLKRVSKNVLMPSNQRLVLVLDGLDEAASDEAGRNALLRYLPQVLPPWVVVLCASRPVYSDLNGLEKVQRIDLDETTWWASNEAAVRAFWEYHAREFSPPLDAALIEEAVRSAGGNLLHAIRLRDWLDDQPPERRVVTNIPQQLEGFAAQIWGDLIAVGEPRCQLVLRGLGIACAAREALPAYLFGELLGWGTSSDEVDFLRLTRPFLRQEQAQWHGGQPAYRLYHDYFREFVVQRLGEQRIRELHRLLVDKLAVWPPAEEVSRKRDYALRHAVEHRIAAGTLDEARKLCTNIGYLQEKCRELGVGAVESDYEALIRALSGERSLELLVVLAALGAESRRLRGRSEVLPALLYNRLRCAGWSPKHIENVLRFPAGLPPLRLRHGVRLGPTPLHAFLGHEKPVVACAITPDGRHLVSASVDRTLRLWALGSGDTVAVLRGHEDDITACAVTADGKTVVSASTDATVRLWDVAAKRLTATLDNQGRWATSCGVSPDGQRIVVGSDNGALTVWERASFSRVAALEGHTDYVTACLITRDGRRLVSASRDRTVRVWDLASGSCERVLGREVRGGEEGPEVVPARRDEKAWVTALVPLSGGTHVLAASGDGLVLQWEIATGRCVRRFGEGQGRVDSLATLHAERHLLCGMSTGAVHVWEIASGQRVRVIEAHEGALSAIAVLPNGRRMVSASHDRSLKLWEVGSPEGFSSQGRHAEPVAACAVTPRGNRAVSASEDGTLKVWDVKSGACTATLEGHEAPVTTCAITADGRQVLSGARDGSVRLWSLDGEGVEIVAKRAEIVTKRFEIGPDHDERVSGCALLGGGRVLTTSPAGGMVLREPTAGPSGGTQDASLERVDGCALTLNGERALLFSRAGVVQVWDTAAGRLVRSQSGFVAPLLAGAMTPDGRRAVLAREDGVLEVWDLLTGQRVHELRGHERRVFGCAVSQDGKQVVSASEDETLKIWNLESGACVGTVQGTSWFRCVALGTGVICAGDEEGNLWMVNHEKAPKKDKGTDNGQLGPVDGAGTSVVPTGGGKSTNKGKKKLGLSLNPPPPQPPPPRVPEDELAARVGKLRDFLACLYGSAPSARMIAVDAGLNMTLIELRGTPREVWQAILEEAKKSLRVISIIDRVLNDYPEYPELKQARKELGGW